MTFCMGPLYPNMVACIHAHAHTHTLPRRGWVYVPHNPLNLGRGLWQFWPIDNGANDILWLPRLGCKENATPGPWEPRLGAVRTLKLAHLQGPRRWAELPQLMSIITDQTCERARLQRSWDPQDCGAMPSCPWNSDPRNLRGMISDCFRSAGCHETLTRLMELLRVPWSHWFPQIMSKQ